MALPWWPLSPFVPFVAELFPLSESQSTKNNECRESLEQIGLGFERARRGARAPQSKGFLPHLLDLRRFLLHHGDKEILASTDRDFWDLKFGLWRSACMLIMATHHLTKERLRIKCPLVCLLGTCLLM